MRDAAPSLVLSCDGLLVHEATGDQRIVQFAQHRDGASGRCWVEASFDGVPSPTRPLPPELVAWWEGEAFPGGGGGGGGCRVEPVAVTRIDGTPVPSLLRECLRRPEIAQVREQLAAQRERTAAMRRWLDEFRAEKRTTPVVAMAAELTNLAAD